MRILIVEDEVIERDLLKQLIAELVPMAIVVGEAGSVEEGKRLIEETAPDLVLMDIELKDGTSFEILKLFPEKEFALVFITAYNQYAVEAFRYSAVDYLLKPLQPEELAEAIRKVHAEMNVQKILRNTLLKNLEQPERGEKKLVLRTAESYYIVKVDDVIRIESESNYTHFYTVDKQHYLVCKTIKEYESMLKEASFMRIHQSHLVNINRIKQVNKRDGLSVIMTDGCEIPVAMRKRNELMEMLKKFEF